VYLYFSCLLQLTFNLVGSIRCKLSMPTFVQPTGASTSTSISASTVAYASSSWFPSSLGVSLNFESAQVRPSRLFNIHSIDWLLVQIVQLSAIPTRGTTLPWVAMSTNMSGPSWVHLLQPLSPLNHPPCFIPPFVPNQHCHLNQASLHLTRFQVCSHLPKACRVFKVLRSFNSVPARVLQCTDLKVSIQSTSILTYQFIELIHLQIPPFKLGFKASESIYM
jgi:hypothetical protein